MTARSTNNVRICGPQMAMVRRNHGYAQREWGALLGLSEKRVQQIEAEMDAGVYRRTIRKIAAVMGVSVEKATKMLESPAKPLDFSVVGEAGEKLVAEELWTRLDEMLEQLAEIQGTDVPGILEMLAKGTAPGRAVRAPSSPSKGSASSTPPTPARSRPSEREEAGGKKHGGRSK